MIMAKIKLTYDEALAQLNMIVSEIENGELSINALSVKVKEAMELIKFCKSQLKEVQNEIEKIFEDE
jgi:exodeoxyribonuclease VII small subunit